MIENKKSCLSVVDMIDSKDMMNKYLKSLSINRYIMCHTFFASMAAFYLLLVLSLDKIKLGYKYRV